jgi:hypothetical protein
VWDDGNDDEDQDNDANNNSEIFFMIALLTSIDKQNVDTLLLITTHTKHTKHTHTHTHTPVDRPPVPEQHHDVIFCDVVWPETSQGYIQAYTWTLFDGAQKMRFEAAVQKQMYHMF